MWRELQLCAVRGGDEFGRRGDASADILSAEAQIARSDRPNKSLTSVPNAHSAAADLEALRALLVRLSSGAKRYEVVT